MKQCIVIPIILVTIICAFLFLNSCEKHEGIGYYYSKCEAELNGQFLIDQSRFDWGLGIGKTPFLGVSEYKANYESKLSTERGNMPLYYVYIQVSVDEPWEYLTEPQTIKFTKIEGIDEENRPWDYRSYCDYYKINCATIFLSSNSKTEIVKEGSFQITEYDMKKRVYKGKFTLLFSEGTLKGDFSIY